jgi:Leucine-rich repeat (LRR) protein
MAKLPDELCDLHALETLDISHNNFLTLPSVVFKMKKLRILNANTNKIFEIDFDLLDVQNNSLELVDLRFNPLTGICYDILKGAKVNFKIEMSDRQKEEWEDLDI